MAKITKAQRSALNGLLVYGRLAENLEGNYKMEQALSQAGIHCAHIASYHYRAWSNACGWSNEARKQAIALGLMDY